MRKINNISVSKGIKEFEITHLFALPTFYYGALGDRAKDY